MVGSQPALRRGFQQFEVTDQSPTSTDFALTNDLLGTLATKGNLATRATLTLAVNTKSAVKIPKYRCGTATTQILFKEENNDYARVVRPCRDIGLPVKLVSHGPLSSKITGQLRLELLNTSNVEVQLPPNTTIAILEITPFLDYIPQT